MKPLNNDIWLTVNRVWQPATEMKLSKERHLADREWVGGATPLQINMDKLLTVKTTPIS